MSHLHIRDIRLEQLELEASEHRAEREVELGPGKAAYSSVHAIDTSLGF